MTQISLHHKGKDVTAVFNKVVIWCYGGSFEGTLILELECSESQDAEQG
jgi:hypothetical protein